LSASTRNNSVSDQAQTVFQQIEDERQKQSKFIKLGLAQREKVTDEGMPPQTFFDIAVIHILTTSTIDHLRELYPEGRKDLYIC
jgi:hypothetical protein